MEKEKDPRRVSLSSEPVLLSEGKTRGTGERTPGPGKAMFA